MHFQNVSNYNYIDLITSISSLLSAAPAFSEAKMGTSNEFLEFFMLLLFSLYRLDKDLLNDLRYVWN